MKTTLTECSGQQRAWRQFTSARDSNDPIGEATRFSDSGLTLRCKRNEHREMQAKVHLTSTENAIEKPNIHGRTARISSQFTQHIDT